MEHIQLQTPWKRGGFVVQNAGIFVMRSRTEIDHQVASVLPVGFRTAESWEYQGPLSFSAPEPMPELVQVEGCHPSQQIRWGTRWQCYAMLVCDDADITVIQTRHPNKRTARLAFNAAARVMNGEGK